MQACLLSRLAAAVPAAVVMASALAPERRSLSRGFSGPMDAHASLEMPPSHHSHHSWYSQKRVQLLLLAGLAALLVIVMAGPRPRVHEDGHMGSGGGGSSGTDAAAGAQPLQTRGAVECGKGALVQVEFYGESLCPDCQHMVRDVLAPMFANGEAELMDLTYHAFGNVKNNTDGSFTYQHGPNEGKYNRYILCAQHAHPKQREWFPYVKCMADNMRELDGKADGCASEQGWEPADVSGCANGDQGKQLEQAAAHATWALQPPKTFVPWIVVNGVAIGNDFERLALYVCAAAPIGARPDACYDLPAAMRVQG